MPLPRLRLAVLTASLDGVPPRRWNLYPSVSRRLPWLQAGPTATPSGRTGTSTPGDPTSTVHSPIGEVAIDATTPVVDLARRRCDTDGHCRKFRCWLRHRIGRKSLRLGLEWAGRAGHREQHRSRRLSLDGFGQPGPTGPCADDTGEGGPSARRHPDGHRHLGEPGPSRRGGLAIGSNGKLYAWGDNGSGQLGDGNTNESDAPVVVSLPSGVTPTAIAGEPINGYAIGSDGKLYAWGYNGPGRTWQRHERHDSSATPRWRFRCPRMSLPRSVAVEAVTVGGYSYMVGSDGNLYAWGYNGDGELGDGTTTGPTHLLTYPSPSLFETCSTLQHHAGKGIPSPGVTRPPSPGTPGWRRHWVGRKPLRLGEWSTRQWIFRRKRHAGVGLTPYWEFTVSLGQGSSGHIVTQSSMRQTFHPSITTQPTSQSVKAGLSAELHRRSKWLPAPTVQWKVSTDGGATFSPVAGATTDTLTIADTTPPRTITSTRRCLPTG